MVLDDLSDRERYGVAGAFIVAVAVSLTIGFGAASLNDTESTVGDASTDDIQALAQQLMDQDVAQQEQQLTLMAEQNENISAEDVFLNSEVREVADSEFESLYRVTIDVTGNVPNQAGELESIEEEEVLYISKDGLYIFQPPVDLEAQQAAAQEQPPVQEGPVEESPEDELDEEIVIE